MKKILSIVLIAMMGLAFAGCTKSSSGSTTPAASMTATVGGTAFTATDCYESGGGAYYTFTGQTGTSLSGPHIVLNIKSNNIATGTYALDGTGTGNIASYFTNGSAFSSSASGSVTITAINAGVSMSGTFNFVCTDGTSIANGSFVARIP